MVYMYIIIYCYLQCLIDFVTNLVQLFSRFPVFSNTCVHMHIHELAYSCTRSWSWCHKPDQLTHENTDLFDFLPVPIDYVCVICVPFPTCSINCEDPAVGVWSQFAQTHRSNVVDPYSNINYTLYAYAYGYLIHTPTAYGAQIEIWLIGTFHLRMIICDPWIWSGNLENIGYCKVLLLRIRIRMCIRI